MTYIPGDFWRICDVCGFKYRASQTKKRWDGLFVCDADYEERHPQDFVRGLSDLQKVPDPRPEGVDTIIGTLQTTLSADHVPGNTTISVTSSVRMVGGDKVDVFLDSGDIYAGTIQSVPDTTSVVLTEGLSGAASSGNLFVDRSALSTADIG